MNSEVEDELLPRRERVFSGTSLLQRPRYDSSQDISIAPDETVRTDFNIAHDNLLDDSDDDNDILFGEFKDEISSRHSQDDFDTKKAGIIFIGLCAIVSIIVIALIHTSKKPKSPTPHNTPENICPVFCHSEILDAMELSGLFKSSKEFVDMPLKFSSDHVLAEFRAMAKPYTAAALKKFLEKNFADSGSDLTPIIPIDFSENPKFLTNIADSTLREWAKNIHSIWKDLARRPNGDININPDRHTLLKTEHPIMIVPGGRFTEMYYWDTYWIIRGLEVSGLHDTARKIVENLLDFVEDYHFVPNGSRKYYLTRSQPPLLALMVDVIYKSLMKRSSARRANEFLENAVPRLRMEYDYWMSWEKHAVEVSVENKRNHILNRYFAETSFPRPEMYSSDYKVSQTIDLDDHHDYFSDIVATAETGWDFSSRFADAPNDPTSMSTRQIIPVDLNDYLCRVEGTLSRFYNILQNAHDSVIFEEKRNQRLDAMEEVLWDDSEGQWRDWNFVTKKFGATAVASNFIPLWGRCFDERPGKFNVARAVHAFNNSKLLMPAGVATTLVQGTGQQWDFPNAWAPVQHMMVEGLIASNVTGAGDIARTIALRWLQTNFLAFMNTTFMHEKYDARYPGAVGGGGEYTPQKGFGWTNGVALLLLERYGADLVIDKAALAHCKSVFYFNCTIWQH